MRTTKTLCDNCQKIIVETEDSKILQGGWDLWNVESPDGRSWQFCCRQCAITKLQTLTDKPKGTDKK